MSLSDNPRAGVGRSGRYDGSSAAATPRSRRSTRHCADRQTAPQRHRRRGEAHALVDEHDANATAVKGVRLNFTRCSDPGRRGVSGSSEMHAVADSPKKETLLRIRPGEQYETPVSVHPSMVEKETLPPARERELMLAAAAGDRAAREELVHVFLPAIAGVARRYRGVESVQRSELLRAPVRSRRPRPPTTTTRPSSADHPVTISKAAASSSASRSQTS